MDRRSFLSSVAAAAAVGVPSLSTESESVGNDEVEGELVQEVGDRRVYHYRSDHYDYVLRQWTVTDATDAVLDRILCREGDVGCWYVDDYHLLVVSSPSGCSHRSRSYRFGSDISRSRTVYDDGRTEVSDWDAVEEEYVREFDSSSSG
jgi:hypothetical protein